MKNAKVTISRPPSFGKGVISIQINDADSGLHVIRVEMAPDQFAECITGLASCQANVNWLIDESGFKYLGKKRIVNTVHCIKTTGYDKKEQKQEVEKDFLANYEPHGWLLFNDGTNTQQPAKHHNYIIVRYEDVPS